MTAQITIKPAEDKQAPPAEVRPRRILIAEDEHLLARSLGSDLVELGYHVIGPAPNGEAALKLAATERPDLALMDIRMPILDGLSAAHTLFADMNVPTVILSAYSDPPYVQAGTRTGVFGYLLKPVSMDEVRVMVTIAWARFQDHEKLKGQVSDLETRLYNRKFIERAKGVLMQKLGITEDQAMRSLQRQARDSRRPMVELARSILDAQGILNKMDTKTEPPAEAKP